MELRRIYINVDYYNPYIKHTHHTLALHTDAVVVIVGTGCAVRHVVIGQDDVLRLLRDAGESALLGFCDNQNKACSDHRGQNEQQAVQKHSTQVVPPGTTLLNH